MKTVFIYALKCPLTGKIRYVGKSKAPNERLRGHCNLSNKESNHRACWIRSLKAQGLQPILEIIDEVPEEHWQQLEIAYIEYFREAGHVLTNATEGGEGIRAGYKHSLETRVKISAVTSGEKNPNFGKVMSTEQRAKISVSRTGKSHTPETRVKISAAIRGEKHPNFGKTTPPKVCAKMRVALTGRKHSVETRAKIGAAHLGRKQARNTSGFVGVYWEKRRKKWKVTLSVKVNPLVAGFFLKLEDAVFVRALAFDKYCL